jgi:hypothetical protein
LLAFMAGANHHLMDWGQIVLFGLIAAAITALLVFYVHKAWIFTTKVTAQPPSPGPSTAP